MLFKKAPPRPDPIAECLRSERETHEEFLEVVYRALLGRAPDPGGLQSYKRQIEEERSAYCLQRIIQSIAESDEARRRRG